MAETRPGYSLFNVRDGKPNWLAIAAESEKEALAAFAQQAQRGPVMLFYGDILIAVARSGHIPLYEVPTKESLDYYRVRLGLEDKD